MEAIVMAPLRKKTQELIAGAYLGAPRIAALRCLKLAMRALSG